MKQILIVDDRESALRFTEWAVNDLLVGRRSPPEVHCFTDPEQVSAHVLGSPASVRCLLVTDWKMNGGMDGVELVKHLHDEGAGRLNSALVATSHEEQDLPEKPDVPIRVIIIPHKPFEPSGQMYVQAMISQFLRSVTQGA